MNFACLFFLSRISVGSFSPQPGHAYIVVIPLTYIFSMVLNGREREKSEDENFIFSLFYLLEGIHCKEAENDLWLPEKKN